MDADGIALSKPVRSGVVSKYELVCFAIAVVPWLVAALFIPEELVLVPEYVTAANFCLLLSTIVALAVACRQFWLWWRWWSISIDIVLLVAAVFVFVFIGHNLIKQLQPAPSEGFVYGSSFLCSTNVARVLQKAGSQERLYVLEQHCIPDGLESRVTYIRNGNNVLMRRLD